jgi:hypothetical protein
MKTIKAVILILLSSFIMSCSSEDFEYEVTVNSNHQLGKVSGDGIYGHAKVCTVSAYSENNDEIIFSGWYINEQLVSYVPDYTFQVVSNTNLEARFVTPDKFQDFTGQIAWTGVRDAQVITYKFSYPLSANVGEKITINYKENLSVYKFDCKSTIGSIEVDSNKKQLYFSPDNKGIAIITLSGNTSLECKFCITVR